MVQNEMSKFGNLCGVIFPSKERLNVRCFNEPSNRIYS